MTADNVVPLFGNKGGRSGGNRERQSKSPFFSFPKGTRFELTPSGQAIISLDPNASEEVKKTWQSYLKVTIAMLVLRRVSHHVQYKKNGPGMPKIPDVIRIDLLGRR